ncbi:MAG: hypothetical protein US30_C0008G0017 [Candidatus Moranbacteria bacterium GW2011_GWF2_36_839]|nr:MAG: hypothetical protein US27_C0008G0017 [Candidatus Moranbacteria bacterium GW2011_GWF1_36_78]KKQ16999.1 MAG: hypothetical protein US30_C0008G0017 [Candidatus Moranbacteria bacterium GW2011_GWF2_36_839]HAT74011.1 hypothetical protein [Candidatus Moranbacteria bacterium]HBY11175.1 hypothetical protein [Candidatus Moranbacteria bacterium]
MNWKNNFKKGKEIILATSSKKGMPNANVVISRGFIDGKLLLADCQMDKTIKNLQENRNICVIGGYIRLKGVVKIFSSGKYFKLCIVKEGDYKVKNAILVTIKEIFDLDKVKILK